MASDFRLVLVPVLVSLLVTLLRLTGEVLHLSERWFSTATGGILPSGWTWLFGITWLPVIFGPYFALALRRAGLGAPRGLRVLAVSSLGAAVVLGGFGLLLPRLSLVFPVSLFAGWAVMLAGAALQVLAWPRLCRVLLIYGLGSRAPVALLMFLAMWSHWGTHYDYVDMPLAQQLPLFERFLWLALIPQLVFWTAFTVILGSLGTGLYLVLFERRRAA